MMHSSSTQILVGNWITPTYIHDLNLPIKLNLSLEKNSFVNHHVIKNNPVIPFTVITEALINCVNRRRTIY